MTHFLVAVILPQEAVPEDAESWVEKLLAPYDENQGDEGGWFREGSRWDWWVIGGRWDGAIRGMEWEPYYETCDLCGGSGTRPGGEAQFGPEWVKQMNGCNGCKGTGQSEVWPTDPRYRDLGRNICLMVDAAPEPPSAFVTPDGQWIEQGRMGWFASMGPDEQGNEPLEKPQWAQQWAEARGTFANHLVVGVDCHV